MSGSIVGVAGVVGREHILEDLGYAGSALENWRLPVKYPVSLRLVGNDYDYDW
jgi:hypothetical protein